MHTPLNVISLLKHAANTYPEREIVTNRLEGDIHRSNYKTVYSRTAQLAHALEQLGVERGERIGTLAWNTYRHMEIYYAVSGIGAVVHTVNPRLFDQQITYIINHAKDSWLFIDVSFIPLLERIANDLETVKGVIVLCDHNALPDTKLNNVYCYETLIAEKPSVFDWPEFDENTAASLCYTSGTTGLPKGVLYSHRAAVLHAMAMVNESVLDICYDSVVMPMVTMYHASAWGLPYAAPLVGAKLVFTGSAMDGETMCTLINAESVSIGLGVPVLWLTLHQYLQTKGKCVPSLKRVCVGGSASPYQLVKVFNEQYGVYWQPLCGMTETGPLATSAPYNAEIMSLNDEARYHIQTSAGKPVFGVEIEIFDDEGRAVPHDGKSRGDLRVKGPWIMQRYYQTESESACINGWLDTGDVATIDTAGYLRIVDRKKDVIKSGGEWISSIELEDAISRCPGVREACVIGVRHPKWEERPIAIVVPDAGMTIRGDSVKDYLNGNIAKWWMPDDIVVIDELPLTGTGKVKKHVLREQYQYHLIGGKDE